MFLGKIAPIILPTKIEKIDSKLYRGNAVFTPVKALRIKNRGITQIIDLRNGGNVLPNPFRFLERMYCKILNIKYVNMCYNVSNQEKIPDANFFDAVSSQIQKSKKTYIHCHFGLHRTGFAVAMYEKSNKIPKDKILDRLSKCSWEKQKEKNDLKLFIQKFFSN